MRKREAGFSLIELLVVVVVISVILAGTSDMFLTMLRTYKQQSKITETNIEGIIGLELLRRDIESAGYGLPWNIPSGTGYEEATNSTADDFNDAPNAAPRAIVNGDNMTETSTLKGGTDYLVIKALNLPRNDTSAKWTNLLNDGNTTEWTSATGTGDNLEATDRVIVISPGTVSGNSRMLTAPTGTYPLATALTFSDVGAHASMSQPRIVYGIAPEDDEDPALPIIRMPFNRADYYVSRTAEIPSRCAPTTGVLLKAIVNIKDGSFDGVNMPHLLDCVADMQVLFRLDQDGDGVADSNSYSVLRSGGLDLTAAEIRTQLHEVWVYILSHEGEKDTSYSHDVSSIRVGDHDFDVSGIPNWRNYRWKVYTLGARPGNLR